jgi:NAD-dependent dihydropyrimidine dehydrogenase PreA subunit
MSELRLQNYEVPWFFRVLIIDDEIFRDERDIEYRDFFTSFFIREAHSHDIPRKNVEIKFAQDPERGIKLWAEEVFDLTLIDCDFTHWSRVAKLDRTHRFRVNAKRQGVIVLRQFRDWVHGENARFNYRNINERKPFWLWTGETDCRAKALLGSYGLEDDYYLSKIDSFRMLQKHIQICCEAIKRNLFTVAQQIERLVHAIRMSNAKGNAGGAGPFTPESNPMGGVILRVDHGQEAPCLNGMSGINDKYRQAVFPKHPPKDLKLRRFLPLVGPIIAPPPDGIELSDIVQHLVGTEVADIKALCDQYLARQAEHKVLETIAQEETKDVLILDQPFPNRYFAAATPLTGVSVIGRDHAQNALVEKVTHLLKESFGGVILKTAYLDWPGQWKGANWPGIHVQSHMRQRALYPLTTSPTLWNTGRTAMETLPPEELNGFLKKLKNRLAEQSRRVVVSLGSKFCHDSHPFMEFSARIELRNLWTELFDTVYAGLEEADYPLVEINVRHYLREIVKRHLKGDEYLNPSKLNEIGQAQPDSFLNEYSEWLHMLQAVASTHRKRIILKFPYRSDSLGLIRLALSVRRLYVKEKIGLDDWDRDRKFGIRAITIVNALKTPVPQADGDGSIEHSQAWYANPHAWGDAADKVWKYQMSGALLTPYRNQLLSGVFQQDVLTSLNDLGIALFISGGITSPADIHFIEQHLAPPGNRRKLDYGIQIGTWALLSAGPINAGGADPADWKTAAKPLSPGRSRDVAFALDGCLGGCCDGKKLVEACGNVRKPGKGKDKKASVIDPSECIECEDRVCISKWSDVCMLSPKAGAGDNTESTPAGIPLINPRICSLSMRKCISCGACLQTFYCDAFSAREHSKLPPLHDPRQCTGCSLCAQICPTGALKLYQPEEMVILISDAEERKEVLRDLGIPYLAYSPVEDLVKIPVGASDAKEFSQGILKLVDNITKGQSGKINELKGEMKRWVEGAWNERLKGKFVLGEGKREYADFRDKCREACVQSANSLLTCLLPDDPPEKVTAIVRAILWSQLIWSDPGQIFWDTSILIVQSSLCKKDFKDALLPATYKNYKLGDRKGDREYVVRNFAVKCRKSQVVLKETQSAAFEFSGFPSWYVTGKFGEGRLANLDIRGYGGYLLSDYNALTEGDIYDICGMPEAKAMKPEVER